MRLCVCSIVSVPSHLLTNNDTFTVLGSGFFPAVPQELTHRPVLLHTDANKSHPEIRSAHKLQQPDICGYHSNEDKSQNHHCSVRNYGSARQSLFQHNYKYDGTE